MAHYSYSFNNITCIIGGITVEGWSEDATSIAISYIDDQINQVVGSDGGSTTSLIKNYQANITLNLRYGSPTNALLSNILIGYKSGIVTPTPLYIKDNGGSNLHTAPHVSIVKHPDTNFGANAQTITWELRTPELITYIGGGAQLA